MGKKAFQDACDDVATARTTSNIAKRWIALAEALRALVEAGYGDGGEVDAGGNTLDKPDSSKYVMDKVAEYMHTALDKPELNAGVIDPTLDPSLQADKGSYTKGDKIVAKIASGVGTPKEDDQWRDAASECFTKAAKVYQIAAGYWWSAGKYADAGDNFHSAASAYRRAASNEDVNSPTEGAHEQQERALEYYAAYLLETLGATAFGKFPDPLRARDASARAANDLAKWQLYK